MNKEQIKIFNEWVAPVTRDQIRDIISKFYKKTQWQNKVVAALDIGCGDGSATVEVLKKYLPDSTRLWATDKLYNMIGIANLDYGDCGVKFIVSDVLDDEEKLKGRFDCAFSFYCLQNVTDLKKALKNIYNMLKPNGHSLLSFVSRNFCYAVLEKLARTTRWSPYMLNVEEYLPPLHGFRGVELVYENWLRDSGFDQVLVQEEKRKIVYDSWKKFEDCYLLPGSQKKN